MEFTDLESSPIPFGAYRVHHATAPGPGSLAAERQDRSQYRAASADDMAHKAIRLEPREFLESFFPLSPPPTPSADLETRAKEQPCWDHNVFQELEDAENMVEAKIADLFVRSLLIEAYTSAHDFALDLYSQSI